MHRFERLAHWLFDPHTPAEQHDLPAVTDSPERRPWARGDTWLIVNITVLVVFGLVVASAHGQTCHGHADDRVAHALAASDDP